MATVPRKGEFYDTESASGEWARGEDYGDGTTGDERVAAARAKDYVAPKAEPAVKQTGTPDMPSTPEKKRSFKEEFAAARDGSIFEWNGKMYKKEYADKKGMSKPAAKAEADKAQARTKSMEDAAALAKKLRATVKTAPESRPGSESPMAPTKKNAAAAGNKLMSDRYKGRREGFDSKMKKTTGGKTTDYAKGGSVRGAGLAERGVRKCKMV